MHSILEALSRTAAHSGLDTIAMPVNMRDLRTSVPEASRLADAPVRLQAQLCRLCILITQRHGASRRQFDPAAVVAARIGDARGDRMGYAGIVSAHGAACASVAHRHVRAIATAWLALALQRAIILAMHGASRPSVASGAGQELARSLVDRHSVIFS